MGVLDRGEGDDDNETGLKEVKVLKIETTVLSIYAMLALLRFLYILTTSLSALFWVLLHDVFVACEWDVYPAECAFLKCFENQNEF